MLIFFSVSHMTFYLYTNTAYLSRFRHEENPAIGFPHGYSLMAIRVYSLPPPPPPGDYVIPGYECMRSDKAFVSYTRDPCATWEGISSLHISEVRKFFLYVCYQCPSDQLHIPRATSHTPSSNGTPPDDPYITPLHFKSAIRALYKYLTDVSKGPDKHGFILIWLVHHANAACSVVETL